MVNGGGQLPINVPLLQPGTRHFRLIDALQSLVPVPPAAAGGGTDGVTDGSDALPGQIGEYVMANRTINLAVLNNVATDITTITLTAGDWDVQGAVYFLGSSSSGSDDLRAWVNTVSATQPSGDNGGLAIVSTSSGGLVNMLAIPPIRASGATGATIFLSCNANFGSGTMNVQGYVRARRMR
jgi:hypothetical protein